MIHSPRPRATQFIFSLNVAVVSYALIAFLAGICGVFYAVPVILVWIASLVALSVAGVITWTLPPRDMRIPVAIALLAAIMIAVTTVPSLFDGRDQGSIADAAIRLATHHTFLAYTPESDAFFTLYGRGVALNFPGYFYTPDGALLTQFPLPYTAFIAGWYGVFGSAGFVITNALLVCLTILTLTYAARYFVTPRWSNILAILVVTSFPLLWFAKFTLSENLAGALLWSAFAFLLMVRRAPFAPAWYALWITTALLAVTRIEGWWFAFFFIIATVRAVPLRTFVRAYPWHRFFAPLACTVAVLTLTLLTNTPFLVTMAKAFVNESSLSASVRTGEKLIALLSVYALYGLLIPLIASGVLAVTTLWRWRTHRASLSPLLPLALVAPLMIYYVFPHITADHPWMLRRYGFALSNATLFATVIFAAGIPGRTAVRRFLRRAIPACVLLAQLPAFFYFAPYAENRDLAAQIATIGTSFTANDLVLVDRDATGSGWAMMNTPLRALSHTHAVYVFNPADLTRLNTNAFTHVYLIVADDTADRYRDILATARPVHSYHLTTSRLAPARLTDHPRTFPRIQPVATVGTIYDITPHTL